MTSTTQTPQRMHLLDVLRFAAAMAVVLYHFTASPTADRYWGDAPTSEFAGLEGVVSYGWLAVEAFFIISGFAILWSSQGRTLAQYTGSRIGRLVPAFWACVLVTAALQAVWTSGRQLSVGETLVNLTLTPDLFGVTSSQVVYWTLLVELKFYLLVALLLLLGPLTRTRVVTLALAWPAVGFVMRGLGYPELAEHFVVRHSPYIGLGMLMFLLYQDATKRRSGQATGAQERHGTAVVLGAGAILLALSVHEVLQAADRATDLQGNPVDGRVAVAILLAIIVAVWFSMHPRAVVRNRRLAAACTLGGALTYPLYLVHTQFGWAVTEFFSAAGAGVWVTLAAATGVSLVVALAIHYGAERVFSTRLRRAVTRALSRSDVATRSDGGTSAAQGSSRTPQPDPTPATDPAPATEPAEETAAARVEQSRPRPLAGSSHR
ncbi:acyltransferase [Isoptericola halotolerans]|uniref:Peptidoglycan/LPS O-acetylase OafA/YrhL n=1 Tax=Isoptericola halotolerans TaxID=300560 RepID=A0ABX2A439_9MICO|nr:acyltransferase family protein [Isoptericola halotolerans]NOV97604.1 peptidoglycan/LPS O-acetylase OafA/YrhL [Isoptericola halotolerans]